ncbi:UNVERIFIED_CONTAM: hypothetical protein Slati_4124500 [Sesamum latifolium]|uniref:Reverse transcriptase domain-containing protein n=1 Tax=Sesamum latifolium TaxID=2727402 RepID=A0AAW2TB98_9LAMI
MFKAAESSGLIQGVRVARGAPRISHLLFADDTLVFCEATAASFHGIRMILDRYAQASGQIINLEKSSMVLSRNVSHDQRMNLINILGVPEVPTHIKYLGLPAIGGKIKKKCLQTLGIKSGRGFKDGMRKCSPSRKGDSP